MFELSASHKHIDKTMELNREKAEAEIRTLANTAHTEAGEEFEEVNDLDALEERDIFEDMFGLLVYDYLRTLIGSEHVTDHRFDEEVQAWVDEFANHYYQ